MKTPKQSSREELINITGTVTITMPDEDSVDYWSENDMMEDSFGID